MLKITRAMCDYKRTPDNNEFIENPRPAFSYVLESDGKNIMQKSYRIEVYKDDVKVCDTGIVESD